MRDDIVIIGGGLAGSEAAWQAANRGVKVTLYEVTLTPDQMANPPGATAEELKTIAAAHSQLTAEGYTGTTMRIGIGDDGLIHEVTSITNFKDGGKVTLTATFSNFGKAAAESTTTTTQPTSDSTAPTTGAPETTTEPSTPTTPVTEAPTTTPATDLVTTTT